MDILDDMGVSKLSAKVFLKVNFSFKGDRLLQILLHSARKCILLQWITDPICVSVDNCC